VITIITDESGINSNSYGTLEEAESYFETRYHNSYWNDKSDEEKKSLLVNGARVNDSLFDWYNDKNEDDQSMAFPRDDDSIPNAVKYAQYEMAYYIAQVDATTPVGSEYSSVSAGQGAVNVVFNINYRPEIIPSNVMMLLRAYGLPLIIGDKDISFTRVERG